MFHDFADLVAFMQSRYVPEKGGYRRDDGSIDICHTELELLQMWNFFIKCVKPKTIVETGVYYGLSTCFLADALKYNGIADSKIYCVDPWKLEHYWNGLDIEKYIKYIPKTSQEAADEIKKLEIDALFIDSIHTYDQSSWELMTFEPHLREGGYIIMHDSLFFDGVGRTAKHLYDSPRFEVLTIDTPRKNETETIHYPVSQGCTIARKIRNGAPIMRDAEWIPLPESIPRGPDALLRIWAKERSGA